METRFALVGEIKYDISFLKISLQFFAAAKLYSIFIFTFSSRFLFILFLSFWGTFASAFYASSDWGNFYSSKSKSVLPE